MLSAQSEVQRPLEDKSLNTLFAWIFRMWTYKGEGPYDHQGPSSALLVVGGHLSPSERHLLRPPGWDEAGTLSYSYDSSF
jgi:hypothetical protein